MRVINFGLSAGYAPSIQQNSDQSANINTVFPRELEHNNGNLTASHYKLLNEYEYNSTLQSSADEFVKKALSSSLSNRSNENQHGNCIQKDKNNHFLKTIHKQDIDLDNWNKSPLYNRNTNITFGSVNKSFNNTLIDEYQKDLKKINFKQPIELNTRSSESDNSLQKPNEIFPYECKSNSPDMTTILTAEERLLTSFKVHNEFEDQPMVDICADSMKNFTEEPLSSPTTSSLSLDTSKISYFPRGIINPNYPGFQHFAHTLSEHFIGNSSSDTNDSDISEYEMEDLSLEQAQLITNFDNQNNINNNAINLDINISTQTANNVSIYSEFTNVAINANCNTSVRKRLDHMCTGTDNDFTSTELISSVDYNLPKNELKMFEPKTYTTANQSSIIIESQNCFSPPDILIKNNGKHLQLSPKKENRPDLLYGVSPQHVRNKNNSFKKYAIDCQLNTSMETISLSQLKIGHIDSNNCLNDNNIKDELNVGMTPVDIIGDFGQEVEREFGLLVSGYRRIVDSNTKLHHNDDQSFLLNKTEKMIDAALSNGKEEINSKNYVKTLNQITDINKNAISNANCIDREDNNAVDWTGKFMDSRNNHNGKYIRGNMNIDSQKPKYQKPSYDDRQLPPVAIDYKRCQQSMRTFRKYPNSEKNSKGNNLKLARISKTNFSNRLLNTRTNGNSDKGEKINSYRLQEEEEQELHQYQQLMSDKESILSNSKYTKLSSWAKYLKNSAKKRGPKITSKLISPSSLELFDAYKIGKEMDLETLQKHLKLAKEIEKRRRYDREEIRKRLAMESEEYHTETKKQNFMNTNVNFYHISDISSDNESHSSDSETCPKLSKTKIYNKEVDNTHLNTGSSSSVNCINQNRQSQTQKKKKLLSSNNDDREYDFFTKQAKLQIEARLALSQARQMAHMQMDIERQNQNASPITEIIRDCLKKIGVKIVLDKRRVSRQMLTNMNTAQLQILVNTLHTNIEKLNETLVHFLMDRDDLHMGQDTLLGDIEELTHYIGTKEQMIKQHSKELHFGKQSK